MKEIYLDPKEYQGQVDSFASGAETIKTLNYEVDHKSVLLESVDKYQECVAAVNDALKSFESLLTLDEKSMRAIMAAWMNRDSTIASKTLGELLTGK